MQTKFVSTKLKHWKTGVLERIQISINNSLVLRHEIGLPLIPRKVFLNALKCDFYALALGKMPTVSIPLPHPCMGHRSPPPPQSWIDRYDENNIGPYFRCYKAWIIPYLTVTYLIWYDLLNVGGRCAVGVNVGKGKMESLLFVQGRQCVYKHVIHIQRPIVMKSINCNIYMWLISKEELIFFPSVPFWHHICHAWPSTLPLQMTMSYPTFFKVW